MAEFPNTGIISKNTTKQQDSHPDIKGNAEVTCPCCNKTSQFWLDGWKNERKDGSGSFYKLKLKPKDTPANRPASSGQSSGSSGRQLVDDEVPF